MRKTPLLALLLIVPVTTQAQTLKNPKTGCAPLATLDSVAMMRDVFRMADDSMRGRFRGTPESVKARNYLASRFKAVGLIPVGKEFIHPVEPTLPSPATDSIMMANVIGMVKGTKFPEQYIVVTGHYDHLKTRAPATPGDSIFNGADDNASGSSALANLAQHFVKNTPAHSMIFAAVDAEEGGMWGSKAIVNTPLVPLDQILLNVNMDMIGRNEKNQLYASGPGKYPLLRPLVEESAACAPITLTLGHDDPANRREDWTTQSDQGSFHAKGIPFVYFGVEDHPDYHRVSDTPERLMPGFYVGAIRTVADFLMRFDAKPVGRGKP